MVKQLISSFIDPLFKLLIPGNQVLSDRSWSAHFNGHIATFGWGAVVYDLLDFLFILLIIYIAIRLFRLDRLDKQS